MQIFKNAVGNTEIFFFMQSMEFYQAADFRQRLFVFRKGRGYQQRPARVHDVNKAVDQISRTVSAHYSIRGDVFIFG